MAKDYSLEKHRRSTGITGAGEVVGELSAERPRVLEWSTVSLRTSASQLMLAAVMVLGAVLRLWQINSLGFNGDEAVYAGQGAAIVADPTLKEIFPIFRAHPLLFQFVLALGFRFTGVSDLVGRVLAVVAGLATIYLVYQLGKLLYSRKVGLLAALIMALMPYHVIVTRQVLLDGPMVLFATLALFLLARFAISGHPAWLYATGAAMGLTFLTKETGIVLIGAVYAFLSLSSSIRVRIRDLIGSMLCMVGVIAPHFIALALVGRTKTAQQFVLWQLFRRANHDWDFYATLVPLAIGPLVLVAALLGLWLLRSQRSWREALLIAWVVVPTVFFQLWPVKGFQYLLPTAPAIALLAARTLSGMLDSSKRPASGVWRRGRRWLSLLAIGVTALSLLVASWSAVTTVNADEFIAGTGGIPGGREAGEWVRDNVPQGAKLVTIGPSMANIIQFYGHRRTYGLSVSTNPLHRNPVYEPVVNPDRQVREGEIQYFVFDAYSEARSAHFAASLLKYVHRYHGRVVYSYSAPVAQPDGTTSLRPLIVIYEVRP